MDAIKQLISYASAQTIFNIIEEAGKESRFVGGCVRDALLGKDLSNTDIDIATTLRPEQVITILAKHGIKAIPTGIQFGTVTAILDGDKFEITTLRSDIECYGRHAKVEYTEDWKEDALRRDFTINAMSCDLDGTVYDYFNGISDLQNGIIRFVGQAEQRINEDYLRILRFFRFFAYYGKEPLHEEALSACSKLAAHVLKLSGERIQNEMRKIMLAPNFSRIIKLMHEARLLKYIIPYDNLDFALLTSIVRIEHLLGLGPDFIRHLVAILHGCNLDAIKELSKQWKLSKNDSNLLRTLLLPEQQITMSTTDQEYQRILRISGFTYFKDLLVLSWAREAVNHGLAADNKFLSVMQWADSWPVPILPVTGNDIMQLGITEGKKIGELLKKAELHWESKGYRPNREEILNYLTTISDPQ